MSTTPHLQHIWKLNPVCYICELLFSKIPSQHFFLINKKQTILCKIKHRPGELSRSENITVTISGFAWIYRGKAVSLTDSTLIGPSTTSSTT